MHGELDAAERSFVEQLTAMCWRYRMSVITRPALTTEFGKTCQLPPMLDKAVLHVSMSAARAII